MIALRAATLADCDAVWRWNCAPDVRARSTHARAIPLAEHAAWYARRLAVDDPMWVIERDGAAVGVVRIDRLAEGAGHAARAANKSTGRISIALGTEARGRGIGRRAIAEACRAWHRPVMAEILIDNLASRACFEACGFRAAVCFTAPHGGAAHPGHAPAAACVDLITYYWEPEG